MNIIEKQTPAEKRFGAIAVEKGYITKEQLLEAIKIQVEEDLEHGSHRVLGQILLEMRAISPENLPSTDKRFGMVAIEKGYITKEQLLEALKRQIEENLQYGCHIFIGTLLAEMNAINNHQLNSVFQELKLCRKL